MHGGASRVWKHSSDNRGTLTTSDDDHVESGFGFPTAVASEIIISFLWVRKALGPVLVPPWTRRGSSF